MRRKRNGFKSKAYIEWNSQTEQIKTIKRAEWWVHNRDPAIVAYMRHTHRKQYTPMRKIIPHCHIAACGNALSINVWKSAMLCDVMIWTWQWQWREREKGGKRR